MNIFFLLCFSYVCAVIIEVPAGTSTTQQGTIVSNPSHGSLSSYKYRGNWYTVYTADNYQGYDYFVLSNGGNIAYEVYDYYPCANALTYSSGNMYTPTMSIAISSDTITFSVTVGYYRQNINYEMDFAPSMNSVCALGNNPNSNSAPVPSFPGALNNASFGAYYTPSSSWMVNTTNNCYTVNFVGTFSIDTLLQCSLNKNGYCFNYTAIAGANNVQYNGALYINAYWYGWRLNSWQFPVSFILDMMSTNMINPQISSVVDFAMTVTDIGILTIQATMEDSLRTLNNTRYDPSLSLISVNAYTWVFSVPLSVQEALVFSWMVLPDNQPLATAVSIFVAPSSQIGQDSAIGTKLMFYSDPSLVMPSNSFGETDTIYIAAITQDPIYDVYFLNIWLCYSKYANIIPEYDPSNGLYGCKASTTFMPGTNIVQIYSDNNGTLNRGIPVANPGVWEVSTLPNSVAFAFTNYIRESRTYFIHAEIVLEPKARPSYVRRIMPQKSYNTMLSVTFHTSSSGALSIPIFLLIFILICGI